MVPAFAGGAILGGRRTRWDRGRCEKADLHEGAFFLLPAHALHSPQRPEPDSRRLVVEMHYPADEKDGFLWDCAACGEANVSHDVLSKGIVDDLSVDERFCASSEAERRSRRCGGIHPGRDCRAWQRRREGAGA